MEAELELAQAKLAEWKAEAKSSTADVRIKYDRQIDSLERDIDATNIKLRELGESSEDAWEELKDGVESAWDRVAAAFKDATAKLKS